jgi:hypothetical protein
LAWRPTTVFVAIMVMALTLTSCGGLSSAPTIVSTAQQDGTMVGVFGRSGGLVSGFRAFSRGFITLVNAAHHYLWHISDDGHFRVMAAPGTYDLTGFTEAVGTGTCGKATVRGQENRITSLSLTCEIQ